MNFLRKFLNSILYPRYDLYVSRDVGDRNLPTIVMLHGIAATSLTWDKMIEELRGEYRLIAIDLLGFGDSPCPEKCEYTVDDHVRSVRRAIKKLKIKRPYSVIGHSMGTIIAAKYGLLYENELKHVYLMSPPVYQKNITNPSMALSKKIDIYFKIYNSLLENKKFTITTANNIRWLLGTTASFDIRENNWHSFRLSLMNTIINQDTIGNINKINVPVDIIYGSLDTLLISETIDELAKNRNVRVTKVSLVGHPVDARFVKAVVKIIKS